MSEPKRYDLVDKHYGYFLCHKIEGEWVKWEDYARLKAECQARQAENSVLAVECDSLKAEVERLTKAGDEMHCFLIGYIVENRLSSSYLNKLDDGWVNAREVQS